MSRITINGVSMDPVADGPALHAHALMSADSSSSDYILVQAHAPLTAAQKTELQQVGAEILEYVPNDTYICKYRPSDLIAVRNLPFVAWANVYMRGFKIAPALHAAADNQPQAHLLKLNAPASSHKSGMSLVDIVVHRGVDPNTVRDAIGHAAGLDPASLQAARGKFRVALSADRLGAVAAIDEVRNVEPVHEKKLWNSVAIGLVGAQTLHQPPHGLDGSGQIVAVCDTGFDLGSTANVHPAFTGRVQRLYALGRATASDPNGHGTHVCGSVLGEGNSQQHGRIRGAAPGATLIMQSILDANGRLGGLPPDLHQLFQPTYDDGARIHSNSWGDSDNRYTQDAHDVDAFVWENREFVIVFAAGNDGVDHDGDGFIDPGSVGSPGTAKNCITVGASENDRPGFVYVEGVYSIQTYGEGWGTDYPAPPVRDDKLANNPNGMAAFSSRGPTSDGRIKPDVVAPGTGILSARSRAPGVGNGWGPSQDPLFFYEGGTSMATPLVSGCVALLRQHLQNSGSANPSAALVKAILVNTAKSLPGQYSPSETGTIPNSNQGFGRIDIAAAVGVTGGAFLALIDEDAKLDTGDEKTFAVPLPNPVDGLKVTLVWTDPPGETLQNDLDLTVLTPNGVAALGNAAPNSQVHDRTNNVEQVILGPTPAGVLRVRVRAHRVAIATQDFALVVRELS